MRKTPTISKSDFETLADFRYALRQFLRFSEDAALRVGLTPQQHQALLAIKGFPGRDRITLGELAERLQLRHHSAVGLVDRLVVAKFAVRTRSAADRRKVYLKLTRKGEALLGRLSAAHREQLRRIAPRLESLLRDLRC